MHTRRGYDVVGKAGALERLDLNLGHTSFSPGGSLASWHCRHLSSLCEEGGGCTSPFLHDNAVTVPDVLASIYFSICPGQVFPFRR
jgi:hypothetical protein